MRIKCKFIQTQGPIFVAGTNLPDKLTPKHPKGNMELFYDTDLDKGIVIFKGETSVFPIASFCPNDPVDLQIVMAVNVAKDMVKEKIIPQAPRTQMAPNEVRTAQVSTPIDKVQGVKKGKAPKFQGEETAE